MLILSFVGVMQKIQMISISVITRTSRKMQA
jgi:hypothetical protein